MKNPLKNLFGPAEYKFKIQLFRRGETFHTPFDDLVKADNLEAAKQLILTEYDYPEDEYLISFEPGTGYTQMTIIQKDIPKTI